MLNRPFIELLRQDTQGLIDEMAQDAIREEEQKLNSEDDILQKYLHSACDMLLSPTATMNCLMEPLLPRVGVAALVGSSDSGKSSLLRGLAMAVASGAGKYLGFELKPLHARALYVSTEDDRDSLSTLMRRQVAELGRIADDYSRLEFIFDTTNLIEVLDLSLTRRPADLVIVDAFADLYTGPMNENNRVRSFINLFSQLAQKHSTLVIFLHHTGKRTEVLMPSKHNAIGSQGFEAKMRLMMELRPDPVRHEIRHLCVVKGNYLSSDFKHDSFELRFTEGLNFEPTGNRVPFGALREYDPERERRDAERTAEKEAERASRISEIRALQEQGLSMREIAEALGYKNKSSISRLLAEE